MPIGIIEITIFSIYRWSPLRRASPVPSCKGLNVPLNSDTISLPSTTSVLNTVAT